MADETGPERLRVIAEAHTRCADGRIAEGWQIDGMAVLQQGACHDGCDRHPAGDRPFRT